MTGTINRFEDAISARGKRETSEHRCQMSDFGFRNCEP